MSKNDFHRDNHYIPCVYLKNFADIDSKIQTYRTLVSNPKIPEWRKYATKGIAYNAHLYTYITAQGDPDPEGV